MQSKKFFRTVAGMDFQRSLCFMGQKGFYGSDEQVSNKAPDTAAEDNPSHNLCKAP